MSFRARILDMRRTIVLILFAAALVIFGFTAGGHSQPRPLPRKATIPPWFKKFDLDADNQVSLWEWRHGGKSVKDFKKWDRDRDGIIARDEAKRLFAAQNKVADPPAKPGKLGKKRKSAPTDPLDSRPVVYRAGKLPGAVLPPWFSPLDEDRDGQVAMWEWYKRRKDLDEFNRWDRDGDGFITPEEAMYRHAELSTKTLRMSDEGVNAKGELTATGAKSPFPPRKNSVLYRVKLSAGTTYVIDLESTDFDAYLSLADVAMNHIASNDDGGGNLNARIRYACTEDGFYHIVATGLGNPKGEFLLKIAVAE